MAIHFRDPDKEKALEREDALRACRERLHAELCDKKCVRECLAAVAALKEPVRY